MKRWLVLIMVFMVMSFTSSAYAGGYHKPKKVVKKYYNTTNVTNVTNIYEDNKNEFGTMLDAPYMVELAENWYLGTEGGKDLWQTDANEGWFAFGKVTYTGTLFSFKKQK